MFIYILHLSGAVSGAERGDEGTNLTEDVRGQTEQTEDVSLVPGIHHAQHLGYVCSTALTLTGLLSERRNRNIMTFLIFIITESELQLL